jgi:hypothetical protein
VQCSWNWPSALLLELLGKGAALTILSAFHSRARAAPRPAVSIRATRSYGVGFGSSRSKPLAEGLGGMAPALMLCWIEGGAGFFLFGVIARRRRRATGSIAAGTWGVDLRWGASFTLIAPHSRVRGADDGGRRRRDAS